MAKKYGLITYEDVVDPRLNTFNLGDYVQSIAARQFLPEVNAYVSREKLNTYVGEEIKMVMNAWYMQDPKKFPPSPQIDPLYVSIHINSSIADSFFTKETIQHFKSHGPVGTRDNYTRDLLISKGIDAYYTGCMTLTLGQTFKRTNPTDEVLIVDAMYDVLSAKELIKQPLRMAKRLFNGRIREYNWRDKVLAKYFDRDLLKDAVYLTQILPDMPYMDAFELAENYLKRLANAKLVITSRIHCALPCLAIGTPVYFINGGFHSKDDSCRFDGLYDFFNRIDVDINTGESVDNFGFENKIGKNFPFRNRELHVSIAENLTDICKRFIAG